MFEQKQESWWYIIDECYSHINPKPHPRRELEFSINTFNMLLATYVKSYDEGMDEVEWESEYIPLEGLTYPELESWLKGIISELQEYPAVIDSTEKYLI
jgi:hypothetical protein